MKRLDDPRRDPHVFVCHGKRCTSNGAPRVRTALARALRALGLRPRLSRTSCQGHCKRGPVVFVERPRPRVWGQVGEGDVERLARRIARRARRLP